MTTLNEFYKTITAWLLPLGYVEIFKNHPCEPIREFHFIKDQIRVICVNGTEDHCYLHVDIIGEFICSIKSGRYKIGTKKLAEAHVNMIMNKDKLTKKTYSTAEVKALFIKKFESMMPKCQEIEKFITKSGSPAFQHEIVRVIEWKEAVDEQKERLIYLRAISELDTFLEEN